MGAVKKLDLEFADGVSTLEAYRDALAILPDKTRVLLKVFGPLMSTYLKVDLALQSLNKTFGDSSKPVEELGDKMEESGGKVEKSGGAMGKAVSILNAPFVALGGTLKMVGGMFKSLLLGLLPLMGVVMAVTGIVMLFVAAFDAGGGKLKQWLADLPIIGGMMATIEAAIQAVKDIWETLKANLTLPEGADSESFFTAIIDGITMVYEIFSGYWMMIIELISAYITALAESGLLQAIIDAIVSVYDSFMEAWDMIMGAFGDGGVQNFFDMVVGLFSYMLDFLVSSGIFAFIGDIIQLIGEIIGTVVFLAAVIIRIVVEIVKFVYPYVAPYYKMLIAAFGMILTVVMGVVRTIMKLVSAFVALLRGDFDKVGEILYSIKDIWVDVLDGVIGFFKGFINNLIDFASPALKLINKVIGAFNAINPFGEIPEIDIGGLKLAKGGIATGPKSGYPAELHGTEAVVPLPDGRTIPVTMTGNAGGMGGETTININVSGANGDPRKIARMVGDEVGRLFKSRSRTGGFSRGV
jgi:phage-related protein